MTITTHARRGPILAGFCLAALVSPALAGGLYISEFGQPNQGASSAGSQAIAEDASTAVQNPAGIVFLENKRDWLVSAIIIDSKIEFDVNPATTITDAAGTGPPGDGGDAGSTAVGAGLFYARKLGSQEQFGFGFSLVSISGAAMEYKVPANFAGRYWAQEVELLTISVMPSFAYRINDKVSVSIGLPVLFGSLDMDVAIPPLINIPANLDGQAIISDGEDTSISVNLGVMWQATETTRFGFIYVAENELSFDSDLRVTLPPNAPPMGGQIEAKAKVDIPFVQTVRVSIAHDVGDRATILGGVAWENWSSFEDILISTDAGTGTLARDWDDTWHLALGLRWRTPGAWTFYTGAAYDTDPTDAAKRTSDMPMDRQIRISGGATYAKSDTFKIGGVITYADYGDAEINNSSLGEPPGGPGTLVGDYGTNRIIFAGLNFNWK